MLFWVPYICTVYNVTAEVASPNADVASLNAEVASAFRLYQPVVVNLYDLVSILF
jgi:hypothetical protein